MVLHMCRKLKWCRIYLPPPGKKKTDAKHGVHAQPVTDSYKHRSVVSACKCPLSSLLCEGLDVDVELCRPLTWNTHTWKESGFCHSWRQHLSLCFKKVPHWWMQFISRPGAVSSVSPLFRFMMMATSLTPCCLTSALKSSSTAAPTLILRPEGGEITVTQTDQYTWLKSISTLTYGSLQLSPTVKLECGCFISRWLLYA